MNFHFRLEDDPPQPLFLTRFENSCASTPNPPSSPEQFLLSGIIDENLFVPSPLSSALIFVPPYQSWIADGQASFLTPTPIVL